MSKFVSNSFQVPNAFIDEMLDKISGNACKIYLLIVRKTRGWHKEADRISYSQIQKYTGINSRTTISKALDELLDFGLIIMQNGNEKSSNEYRLNDDFGTSKTEEPSPKNGLDKNCTSSENGLASPKNGLEPSPENGHTEIHSFKYTNIKDSNGEKTKKSSAKDKKYTAQDLMSLKLSDFDFSEDDFEKYPNLGEWIFENMDFQILSDFLSIRKTKLTLTALKGIVKQSALANINLNTALEFTIEHGWQSFKADWYLSRNTQKVPYNANQQRSNQRLDFASRVFGQQQQNQAPQDGYINGEWV